MLRGYGYLSYMLYTIIFFEIISMKHGVHQIYYNQCIMSKIVIFFMCFQFHRSKRFSMRVIKRSQTLHRPYNCFCVYAFNGRTELSVQSSRIL